MNTTTSSHCSWRLGLACTIVAASGVGSIALALTSCGGSSPELADARLLAIDAAPMVDAPRAGDAPVVTPDATPPDASPPDAEPAPVWTSQSPAHQPPAAQWSGFSYDNVRHQTIRYGGSGSDPNAGDETWAWDGSDWTQLSPVHSPDSGGAYEPTMAFDSGHENIVLFHTDNSNTVSDTWLWDGTDWTLTTPSNSPGERTNVAMAYDSIHSQMILFGGYSLSSSGQYLNETWAWDGTNWTQLEPTTAPSPRWDANMVFDQAHGEIVLFGGGGQLNNNYVDFAETWTWNGTTWTLHSPTTSPPARESASFAYDSTRSQAILFGGSDLLGNQFNDTWAWDGTDWTQLTTSTAPDARAGAEMAFDVMHNCVVLFGGYASDQNGYVGDTWTLASPSAP